DGIRDDLVTGVQTCALPIFVPWPPDRRPEDALTYGAARGVLIIPGAFGRDIIRGANAPVQLLVDGSDGNTAGLLGAYASRITARSEERRVGQQGRRR